MTISSFGAHANVHVGLGSGRYNWRRQRTENHLYGAGYSVLCTVRKTASSLRTTIGHQRFTFYNTWTGCGWVSNKDEKSFFFSSKKFKGVKTQYHGQLDDALYNWLPISCKHVRSLSSTSG